jgi:hypothetical protein
MAEATPVTDYRQVDGIEILDAVNQDLFQPDRMPPMERYLLPSERSYEAQDPRDDRRRREPDLRIVGTAIAGDLGLAVVQLEDSIPFAVLEGEMVEGYRLASVSLESVTLTLADEAFTLPVVEPDRRSSSSSRDRNSRNQRATEEAARALSERVQQMLQGMGRGGTGASLNLSGVPLARFQNARTIELQRGVVVPNRGGRSGGGGGGGALP